MDKKYLYGKDFSKIQKGNIYSIFKFTDFFTITECSFLNSKFKQLLLQKYNKQITMVKTSLTIYKKNIELNFQSDFRKYLKNNSHLISKELKSLIRELTNDHYVRISVMKYFLSTYEMRNFEEINLKCTEPGKKGIKYIAYCLSNDKRYFNYLILSDNKVTGQILEPLSAFNKNKVSKIKLNRCIVDNGTFKSLSKINFFHLIMKNSNVDDNFLKCLKSKTLTTLVLSNNQISCDGLFLICQNMRNLTKLNLSKNNLTDTAAAYLSVFLKDRNCKLKNINLKENKITSSGLLCLLSVLMKEKYYLEKLNVSHNAIDNFPKRIAESKDNFRVRKFKIGGNNIIIEDMDNLINFVNNNSDIVEFDLSRIIVDNVILRFIFNKLTSNTKIKFFKLNNCYLGKMEIGDVLLSYLQNSSEKKLNKIDLSYNNLNLKGFDKIINTNSLTYLDLQGNDLNIFGEEFDKLIDSILSNKVLKVLNLNNNYLKEKGKKLLSKLSEEDSVCSLETLYLENNKLSSLNIELTNLLQNNKKLKYLYLGHNEIGEDIENNYFFHSVSNTTMVLLCLKENKIRLSFLTKAIQYYKENPNLNCSLEINVKSKALTEAYEKEENVKVYLPLIEHLKINAL